MPEIDGEWIPFAHCTNASGGCFYASRCLGNCSAHKRKDLERRVAELERRLVALEIAFHRPAEQKEG